MTTAKNLITGETRTYSHNDPKLAAISAYAQERGDNNTWDYPERYATIPQLGKYGFLAGNWYAPLKTS